MVAQTKADVRSAAGKTDPTVRKGIQEDAVVTSEGSMIDQAAAAAVVDADQAGTVAAQLAVDGGILPTEAPAQSIGELAQVSTPTTTDTTTTAAETTPPPVVEEAAPLSPWALGGIALLGVGAIAIAVNNDDDDDDSPPVAVDPPAPPPAAPPPAGEPPPAPPPAGEPPAAPPPNSVPTSTDPTPPVVLSTTGTTALSAANFPFEDADADDVLTTVKIGTITATPIDAAADPQLEIDPTSGHGYELVENSLTWEEAVAAAELKGGTLAVLNSEAEALFIKESFELGGGDVIANVSNGAWVGASQLTDSTELGAGWSWVDGSLLPADSPFWVEDFPPGAPQDFSFDGDTLGTEDGEAQYAAIFETFGGAGNITPGIMYDFGLATNSASRYLIEYDNPNAPLTLNGAPVVAGQDIAAADLGALQWNSVFNSGGTVTYTVSDGEAFSTPENTLTLAAPATTGVAVLIDDANSSGVLA